MLELTPFQKEVLDFFSPVVIAIMGRRTGKSTIVREKAINSKNPIIVVPFDATKAVYRNLPGNVTVVTPSRFDLAGMRPDCVIFDEADYISREHIQQVLDRVYDIDQIYFLGTPRSLKVKLIVENNRLKLDFKSNLLWLAYYYGDMAEVFCQIPTFDPVMKKDLLKTLSRDALECEFLLDLDEEEVCEQIP